MELIQNAALFFVATADPKSFIDVEITPAMTSCGFGVPGMRMTPDRKRTNRGGVTRITVE